MRTVLQVVGFAFVLLWTTAPALAVETDSRMTVELHSSDVPTDQAQNILTDIPGMAKLGIIKLWSRLVPQSRLADVSGADAMALLQRAAPTGDGGLKLVFSHDRVTQYLKSLGINYPAEPPHFKLEIHMTNPAGVSMPQSVATLMNYAKQNAAQWGYVIDDQGDLLDLSWIWLSDRQVSLTMGGNPRIPTTQEIRFMAAGDPMPQIQAWLDEAMLKARDDYDIKPTTVSPIPQAASPSTTAVPSTAAASLTLVLTVIQPASLAEQVVFEQALSGNPHVQSMQLSKVDANSRQYLLKLRRPGTDWIPAWFASRGMQATSTDGGWVAQ